MKQYNSYHTIIKQPAKRGKLPQEYASSIDRSTIWRWKKETDEKYLGSELSNINLNFILRLCNISTSVFYHWKNQVLKKCPSYPFRLCRRIYSTQLTQDEVNRMKEMLTDQRFRYWTINSIAYYALRNNIVNVSLATWYNYIIKLCWYRPRLPKKSKYETGIRANRLPIGLSSSIHSSGTMNSRTLHRSLLAV